MPTGTSGLPLNLITAQAVGRPQGKAAIQLQTAELGWLFFEVDQATIDRLRRALLAAEQLLQVRN